MGWSLGLEGRSPLWPPGDLLPILQDPAQAPSSVAVAPSTLAPAGPASPLVTVPEAVTSGPQ